MRKRLTEEELTRLRDEQITRCTGEELEDTPWMGFSVNTDGEVKEFHRKLHHDDIADGYGDDFCEDHYSATFATSYDLGYFSGLKVGARVIDSTGTWELVGSYGGETEVPCPGRDWDPDTKESAPYDKPFKVQRSMAQLTPKRERRGGPRWYGDKRPNNRRAECIYCEERIGEEHGFLGDYVTVEVWKQIAELPTREEIVENMARAFFVDAYITHAEDGGKPYDGNGHPCPGCNLFAPWESEEEGGEHETAGPGQDWYDVLDGIDTPPGALAFAEEAARKIEAEGGGLLPGLYLYTCALPGKHLKTPDAEAFGRNLAMQFMGHGVSWSDDHPDFDFEIPNGESWYP